MKDTIKAVIAASSVNVHIGILYDMLADLGQDGYSMERAALEAAIEALTASRPTITQDEREALEQTEKNTGMNPHRLNILCALVRRLTGESHE